MEGNVQLVAKVHASSWQVPALYSLIEKRLEADKKEMYRVFNMGIGFVLVVEKEKVTQLQSMIGETSYIIGEIEQREGCTSPITELVL